ncbi:Na(+)/H(+) antiporter NhaA [Candidatus Nitrotoga sp. BS]|uniref:Na+/H+ antiporter NhaA n=1 Tax=Candidatus Nitrotoga sp. BS TaxID=2890408 RepID=UPI001EF2C72C|nr:Na+/H+ antiporter NhaA [Candidatus Nitrotoga sp. BS]CAH1198182.1 Na(+)/H(+) antiporter NhaA [Candidatus Nitrotoga sp. BS]
MIPSERSNRLDRPVDQQIDHVLGPEDAEITLVEYGGYDCPSCRAANEVIAGLRDEFGNRLRYVFRHRPITDSDIARRAAELVERAQNEEQFWAMHLELMTRSNLLTEDDLGAVNARLEEQNDHQIPDSATDEARARVDGDVRSADASGVLVTPTFFINGRRYEGPWDQHALSDAMLRTPGHRAQLATLDFLRWGPSAGLLLLLATLVAVALTNSPLGHAFNEFWEQPFEFTLGKFSFGMSIHHWVNDGLLTLFFLVVGLEIKREFTVGHLANRRSAALPIAAAIGGMAVPALLYIWVIPEGPWSNGWGIPMATDTAFAIAVIAVLGSRVPVELRVFLTAAAIVDDIGAILVIAIFYSADIQVTYLVAAAATTGVLALLNRAHVYRLSPYVCVGIVLWSFIHAAGLHATLAGVVLAMFIPTRPPPNLKALMAQANTILDADMRYGGDVLRLGPSLSAISALDAVHDRLESPADRLLRQWGNRSSYVVLPLFALANAGVVMSTDIFETHSGLVLAIMTGLIIGKPLGMGAAAAIAVRMGIARKPDAYTWRHLIGAAALAGIGFTMSLFVAGQAFASEEDFAAAKIAVFAASVIAACVGTALLYSAPAKSVD